MFILLAAPLFSRGILVQCLADAAPFLHARKQRHTTKQPAALIRLRLQLLLPPGSARRKDRRPGRQERREGGRRQTLLKHAS